MADSVATILSVVTRFHFDHVVEFVPENAEAILRSVPALPGVRRGDCNFVRQVTLVECIGGPGQWPNALRPQVRQSAPQSSKAATNKIVCAGQEAGLTIPRRMPSCPTAQIVAEREELVQTRGLSRPGLFAAAHRKIVHLPCSQPIAQAQQLRHRRHSRG